MLFFPFTGIDLLLQAYREEFYYRKDVILIIHSTYKQYELEKFLKNEIAQRSVDTNLPLLLHISEDFNEEISNSLYSIVDCFVAPFRSEGFGLTIVEAMAAALPVIVTNSGPVVDFCPNNTICYLIEGRESNCIKDPCGDYKVFNLPTSEQPTWTEPDITSLRRLMSFVVSHPVDRVEQGFRARNYIVNHFSWNSAYNDLINELYSLLRSKSHEII